MGGVENNTVTVTESGLNVTFASGMEDITDFVFVWLPVAFIEKLKRIFRFCCQILIAGFCR